MNKSRLLKLADLLDVDAKNKKGVKFDMGNWGDIDNLNKPISCGTQACAMGLAALSGAFKRAGLLYRVECGRLKFKLNGAIVDGYEAAQVLFDIDAMQADILFSPTGQSRTDEGAEAEHLKAEQIRDFVKTGEL